jgi:hypothetical protein
VTSAADLIRGGKLRRDEYRVCLDPDLVDEYERLLEAKASATARDADSLAGGQAVELQQEIDGVLEAMEAATVVLVLQALPRREYRTLVDKHPVPRDADGKASRQRDERAGVDYDEFFSELARRSIVEPELDAPTMDLLLDERLSDGQWDELATKCNLINRSTVDVPFLPAGSTSRRRSAAK